MTGTAAIDTATARENAIITSLNRHGNRLVQCLVFSKIDMALVRIVVGVL